MYLRKLSIALAIVAVVLNTLIGIVAATTPWISNHVAIVLFSVVVGFLLLTLVLYRYIASANAKSPQRFVSAFTAGVGAKLFACLIFLGLYLYLDGEARVLVALGTFGIYLVFNVVLIRYLLLDVRSKPNA